MLGTACLLVHELPGKLDESVSVSDKSLLTAVSQTGVSCWDSAKDQLQRSWHAVVRCMRKLWHSSQDSSRVIVV